MMNRRTFIKVTGATTAISLAPWISGCSRNSEWSETLAYPQTLGRFCSKEELMGIGKTYSEKFSENNESGLEEAILGDHKPTSKETLIKHLEEKITTEFANNDLAIVNGWVLSKTEARQVALYSILNA